ncbi:FAD-dependent oxidoreductase [Bradyrhizobium sp. Gha]|uniref:dihydrolipoyl dehydrogenase family protein n=1 Tax=Bradyrhizobium sp. Gha TaxID=1855318 RepID=UPI0008EE5760|nr:FAD-dependent oxidoreductase [Bradyrhizobium sp. Gha]SFH65356.1 Pyruvate/2-oxoglutarate dehydrogenase complex, dihydrolipoamide dehydrogenase (E3) component [Bradyrhizobium sp. Gha]
MAHLVRNGGRFGTLAQDIKIDMAKVRHRKQVMVEREIAFHLHAYKESGAELIMGNGQFVGPKTIEAKLNDGGVRLLAADQIVINVGSRAAIPDVPGLRDARPLTHIEALELDEVPPHLIVLGGGYTGIELAQAYRRFGSRVTIVEPGTQIMGREDPDVAEEIRAILSREGIDVALKARPWSVHGLSGDAVIVTVQTEGGKRPIEGSHLLVAAGRIANTADIGLDKAGIGLDDRGFLRVNDRLETTAPGIFAIGECAGSPQFTHVSVDDFRIVRDNMAGGNRGKSGRLIPHVVFTDPPLARVGLSETEAQREGVSVRVAKLPMRNVLRTEATDEKDGFMKVLVGATHDRILGFTMIGAEAGEVMAIMQVAMLAELSYSSIREAVMAHLTVAEGLGPLFGNMPARLQSQS